jgi:hypothetical protein
MDDRYDNYSAEQDPSGALGLALASIIINEVGGIEGIRKERDNRDPTITKLLNKSWYTPSPIVSPKSPDIKRADVAVIPYNGLENIFYGIHNFNIPLDVKQFFEGIELLGQYYSAGSIKRYNSFKRGKGVTKEPEELLLYLHRLAIAHSGGNFKRKLLTVDQNSMVERFRQASIDNRKGYSDAFHLDYIPSDRETVLGKFHDPNCDGRNSRVYVDRIMALTSKK